MSEKECPRCGTKDCKPRARFSISGPGVLSVKASEILKTCEARRQLRALKKLQEAKP